MYLCDSRKQVLAKPTYKFSNHCIGLKVNWSPCAQWVKLLLSHGRSLVKTRGRHRNAFGKCGAAKYICGEGRTAQSHAVYSLGWHSAEQRYLSWVSYMNMKHWQFLQRTKEDITATEQQKTRDSSIQCGHILTNVHYMDLEQSHRPKGNRRTITYLVRSTWREPQHIPRKRLSDPQRTWPRVP